VFTNVLIGVDGRPGGRDAIALARQLAEPQSQLTFTHVYGGAWMIGRAAALILAAGADYSEQLLTQEAAAVSVPADLVSWPSRSVGRGLHELAELKEIDLLVVGAARRGIVETVLTGDHTIASLNGAPCAVAIAPTGYAEQERRLNQLGVADNGSEESEQALEAARELAARHGSAIRALSVVSLQSIPEGDANPPANWTGVTEGLIAEERRRLQSLDGVDGDAVYGDPGDELLRFGEHVDLLIVGSRGYGPVGRLFNGSVSTFLARHASFPVLVLPRRPAPA
jgi:nucleotide-binding universal stress UspA family protein